MTIFLHVSSCMFMLYKHTRKYLKDVLALNESSRSAQALLALSSVEIQHFVESNVNSSLLCIQ